MNEQTIKLIVTAAAAFAAGYGLCHYLFMRAVANQLKKRTGN